MSDFSPEFVETLTKEIDRMGTCLSIACALRRQITGEADGEQAITADEQPGRGRRSTRTSRKAAKVKRAITPEQLASRQLQGRYLGLIRQFPKSRRGEFQKIAKEKSREAAIVAMQRAKKSGQVGQTGKAPKAANKRTRTRTHTRKPAAAAAAPLEG